MTIQEYVDQLNLRYKSGISREHSYRGDLQTLLSNLLPDLLITNEPSRTDVGAPIISSLKAKFQLDTLKPKTLVIQILRVRRGIRSSLNAIKPVFRI